MANSMTSEHEKKIKEIRDCLSQNRIGDAINEMSALWTKGKSSDAIVNFRARFTEIQDSKLSGELESSEERKMLSSLRKDILKFLSLKEETKEPATPRPEKQYKKPSMPSIMYSLLAILLIAGFGFYFFSLSKPNEDCENAKVEAKRILEISDAKMPTADSNDSIRLQAIKLIMTEHINSTPCESLNIILEDINESKNILDRI